MNGFNIYIDNKVAQEDVEYKLNEILESPLSFKDRISEKSREVEFHSMKRALEYTSAVLQINDFSIQDASSLPYPLPDNVEVYAFLNKTQSNKYSDKSITGYWAVLGKSNKPELKKKFQGFDERKSWGSVVLAGFGPGDPSLLTVKAERSLSQADLIFYDDLTNHQYLNRFRARKVYVGKRKGEHKFDQALINKKLYAAALNGNKVVRLKGGDPLIFGRGSEEFHYLNSRYINTEIIPGVTSAFAAAADAVIPLTERSMASSVVFLSGHDLNKLKIPKADTLVFYMGASLQQELASRIINEGWHSNTPVAIIHKASSSDQKIYRGTLKKLHNEGSGLPSPSIIIVGKTAAPYQSKKWLYTGLSINDWESAENIVHNPLIKLKAVSQSNNQLLEVEKYDRLVFTSKYAVSCFFKELFDSGHDARSLTGLRIDCIGRNTSEALKQFGILVKPLVAKESAIAMVEYYKANNIKGEKILIPGSKNGNLLLSGVLKRMGNWVSDLVLYEIGVNTAIVKHDLDKFTGVIFTSPKTVEAFLEVYETIPAHLKIICRGSQTERLLKDLKIKSMKIRA